MDMLNVARIFQTFMARVVALEDMAKLSSQNLAVFQQELVLANNPSDRLKAYLKAYQKAGYRHCHIDHAAVVKLDNALTGLQNHVQQARVVMEEVQRLLEEAHGMMHEDLNVRLGNIAVMEDVGSFETGQRVGGHVLSRYFFVDQYVWHRVEPF